MERECFLIYKSFYEPIKLFNNEQLGRLFRAIFEYQISQNENVDNDIRIAFEFFKNQFRLDNLKYEKICERNKKNGLKGGRPKKTEENPKNPMGIIKPKKADNENDNENENDNDKDITTTIYEFVEENFGRTLSPIEFEKINSWLLVFSEDIIKYAIELSVMNGKRAFNYVDGILRNWKGCNYKTLMEIKQNEKEIEKGKVPSWFGKEVKRIEMTKEEQEEMEKLLSEFKGDE